MGFFAYTHKKKQKIQGIKLYSKKVEIDFSVLLYF